jgi:uncharacterized membrane protein
MSAMTGIGAGLAVALPILIFATSNVFTGLLATCSIVLSTLCVVAVIPLAGWKFGVSRGFKSLPQVNKLSRRLTFPLLHLSIIAYLDKYS